MDTPMTHMHQEPLALHDSFLNFCPLSASSVSICVYVCEAKRQRNTVCSQQFSHNLSAMLFDRSLHIPIP